MKFITVLILSLLFGIAHTNAEGVRNIAEYNLDEGVGLKGWQEPAALGFDPVSIFPEGEARLQEGRQEFTLEHQGVRYFFASAISLELFVENPSKYEPTYGGWCAYAMASGRKIQVEAKHHLVHNGRAHYFVSNRAKVNFERDIAGHEASADGFWKQISGEDPRNR